jgi:diacylglycerol kinase (ATP)
MNVALVVNLKSGRGRAGTVSAAIVRTLRGRGHEVREVPLHGDSDVLSTEFSRVDAALVVGGDGSIHHALPALIAAGTPVYHVPLGTENLFARAFGMSRSAEHVAAALERNSTIPLDVGTCRARDSAGTREALFAVMCSLGPDASVIHRLHRIRNGPISHLSYVRPCLAEAIAPRFADVGISLDGGERRGGIGMLVVANLKEYALRINPATNADPSDGRLDAVFMPARSGLQMVRRLGRAWLGHAGPDPDASNRNGRNADGSGLNGHAAGALTNGVVYARAREIEIDADGAPVQLDGEAFVQAARQITLGIKPGALRVLLPAGDRTPARASPAGADAAART